MQTQQQLQQTCQRMQAGEDPPPLIRLAENSADREHSSCGLRWFIRLPDAVVHL